MNLLKAGGAAFRLTVQSHRTVKGSVKIEGWWIRDHAPDLWPRTEEDRKAAAAKYGLRDEDYKASPSDFVLYGNYPDLGYLTYSQKDPFENYSTDRFRRNFGEPVPSEWIAYGPDMHLETGVEAVTAFEGFWKFWLIFLSAIGGMYLLSHIDFVNITRKVKKQYAWDFNRAYRFNDPRDYPLVWYSFEPEEPKKED